MVVTNAWVNSATAVSLLLLTPLGLWSVVFAGLFGTGSALVYGWYAVDRSEWVKGRPQRKVIKALLKYGSNFYLAGILGHLQEQGTRLLAVSYLVPAQMAFLTQGQGAGGLLRKVVDPINTMLYSRISRSDQEPAVKISCRAFRVGALLMVTGALYWPFWLSRSLCYFTEVPFNLRLPCCSCFCPDSSSAVWLIPWAAISPARAAHAFFSSCCPDPWPCNSCWPGFLCPSGGSKEQLWRSVLDKQCMGWCWCCILNMRPKHL